MKVTKLQVSLIAVRYLLHKLNIIEFNDTGFSSLEYIKRIRK